MNPSSPAVRPPRSLPQPGTAAALVALGLAGTCTFLNLYATQPLLPMLQGVFGVTPAQAAWTVSAPTIAVALGSPFVGALADRIGHRRLIVTSLFVLAVPTALAATARSIPELIFWRFAQGLVVPAISAVSIAYVGEVWAAAGIGRAMAALITGNVIGGFSGRFFSGITAAVAGWRVSFLVLAAITVLGGFASARWLPPARAREGARVEPLRALQALARRLDGRIVATFAVGFNLLFAQVAMFTYITFHLAAPPYHLGAAQLSSLFVVYLFGAFVTPFGGRLIDRIGSRAIVGISFGCAVGGIALTLIPSLPAMVVGLAICSGAMFISQSAATTFLQSAAPEEVRSTASGVYVSCYYVGGSAGGVLPAVAWHLGGWPGCVLFIVAVQLLTIAIAFRYWRDPAPALSAPAASGRR